MDKDFKVRLRIDFNARCSLGIGKIELLEGIARTGSLSQAARDLRMSYRRAWFLLEDLNASFDEPVARASVGGRGGGGVVLMPLGERLIGAYRQFDRQVQELSGKHFRALGARLHPRTRKKTLKRASIKAPLRNS